MLCGGGCLYRAVGRRVEYSEAASTNIASTSFYMLLVFLLLQQQQQQQQRVQGCCGVVDARHHGLYKAG